jgi:predicted N-acyltransferase
MPISNVLLWTKTAYRFDQKIRMSFPDVAEIDSNEKRKEIRRIRKAREGKKAAISQAGKKRIVECVFCAFYICFISLSFVFLLLHLCF